MVMSEPMIALRQVRVAHDARPVFVDAELVVEAGEVVVVGAPAGAGATTLVELLTGQRRASGVVVAGRELMRLRASSLVRLRQRLGVIPQELALITDATAGASVELALEIAGVRRTDRRRRATAALELLDVDADRTIGSLPMAARQRVAWARAMVRNPDVVLADHPTSHQDGDGSALFVERLAARAADGTAAVVATRDPVVLAAAAERGWRMLTIHRHRLVDPAAIAPVELDAAPHIVAEIERPLDLEAVPNVVPFPVGRSAGNRR